MVRCGGAGGGGGGGGGGEWRKCGGSQAHSRFALMSDVRPHLYDPSEHRNLKHEKAGTIVTPLATPCLRPPTVEATWVPCPLHPAPLAGRMPLTAWHEAHEARSRACETGRMRGGGGRLGMSQGLGVELWAGGVGWGRWSAWP